MIFFKHFFKNSICIIIYTILVVSCTSKKASLNQSNTKHSKDLFKGFQNPPAEARPFVRWWWNGNKIKKEELDRQLSSLKSIGFGGVEINPIAMPVAPPTETESLVWMSDEWIDLVVHASKKADNLGMITDIIAGTGWPFGGEFLSDDKTCQRMVSDVITYKGGEKIVVSEEFLIAAYQKKYKTNRVEKNNSDRTKFSLASISLIPTDCNSVDAIINLKEYKDKNGNFNYSINTKGNYLLSYQLLQQDFRDVTLGAPGGAGPVMDHYKKDVTLEYLNRMKKISERSGLPLNQLIRALFCDSIEVSGANWSDGFSELFYNKYGYKLEPWLAFVFYQDHQEYTKNAYTQNFSNDFKSQLKRVRFDYNNLLVETFLKNFTKTYKKFCEDNGILCRYQAYGTPFLMGMLDGYMIPDIPESNNWLYVGEMKDETLKWSQHRGDKIWNLYASSGAHLTGKKITSCEAMTNTAGVFKTTLEEIKQHDDMNFITGINHSVLHGYNYSPKEVPFPGWIRYGAYFSEQNTWWNHLKEWIDYNARLSYVFQNSQAEKSIAILGPSSDIWGNYGLAREPFHLEPRYFHKIWEPINQLGYSCDYINQNVFSKATVRNGTFSFGKMNFKLLVLASLESITIKTAEKLKAFVASGGKVVVIDGLPEKSVGYKNYKKNDADVAAIIKEIKTKYASSLIEVKQPESLNDFFNWTKNILKESGIKADVELSNPDENVFQMHQSTVNKKLYFFTNVNRNKAVKTKAKFPVQNKYPYQWNPETGKRTPFYFESNSNELEIQLEPLESLLLVFEDEKPSLKTKVEKSVLLNSKLIESNWEVVGNRVDGKRFTWNMSKLINFGASTDTTQNSFAGEIVYKTEIDITDTFTHLDLGNVNEGITELYINGQKVGKRWYGKAVYPISELLRKGKNSIEIKYTSILANYCMSLDNAMTNTWTRSYIKNGKVALGLEGPLNLKTYK